MLLRCERLLASMAGTAYTDKFLQVIDSIPTLVLNS